MTRWHSLTWSRDTVDDEPLSSRPRWSSNSISAIVLPASHDHGRRSIGVVDPPSSMMRPRRSSVPSAMSATIAAIAARSTLTVHVGRMVLSRFRARFRYASRSASRSVLSGCGCSPGSLQTCAPPYCDLCIMLQIHHCQDKKGTLVRVCLSRLFYSVYGVGLSHHHHGGRIHHGDLVPQNCLGLLGASCDGRPSGTRSLAALDALGPRSHAQDLHPCRRACVVLVRTAWSHAS